MGETDARQRRDTVAVTKSSRGIGTDSQLVTVSVRTKTSEPAKVTLSDPVPASHTLRTEAFETDTISSDGKETRSDGTLVIEHVVDPDGVAEFSYRLDGPSDQPLSQPTIETVSDVVSGHAASPRVSWASADGDTQQLAVRTDGSSAFTLCSPEESVTSGALRNVAIGVVLTERNEDAVLGTALRARKRGNAVLIVPSVPAPEPETIKLLEQIGAVMIKSTKRGASQGELYQMLSEAARERGAAGVILQTRDCPRIDYERTGEAFKRVNYEVVAIPKHWEQPTESAEIVIGIPAYNAAGSIGAVVRRAAAYADEVLVIDDGSSDETAERAREAGATVVVHERNRGYGGALKTLFREGAARDAAHLVVIDADGQHDPADIPNLVETQRRNGTDIVIGSRYVGQRSTEIPLIRSVGLAVINHMTNASLGKLRPSGFIRDTQSGYRAYSGYAVKSLAKDRSIGDNMGASTDILYHAHRKRLSVSEVETTISYEVENASSQGSISHGVDLVRNIFWTVEYGRPLLILGVPGSIVTLLGTIASVVLFLQFSQTGTLVPAQMVIAILYVIGGVLLSITAVLMHVLNNHPVMKRLSDDHTENE